MDAEHQSLADVRVPGQLQVPINESLIIDVSMTDENTRFFKLWFAIEHQWALIKDQRQIVKNKRVDQYWSEVCGKI